MDGSLPGSSVHGILQARILEWVAIPFSRGSSQLRLNLGLSHCRQIFYHLSHQGSPRKLEWVASHFSRGSSWCRDQTVSYIAGRCFTSWSTREMRISHKQQIILSTSIIHTLLGHTYDESCYLKFKCTKTSVIISGILQCNNIPTPTPNYISCRPYKPQECPSSITRI